MPVSTLQAWMADLNPDLNVAQGTIGKSSSEHRKWLVFISRQRCARTPHLYNAWYGAQMFCRVYKGNYSKFTFLTLLLKDTLDMIVIRMTYTYIYNILHILCYTSSPQGGIQVLYTIPGDYPGLTEPQFNTKLMCLFLIFEEKKSHAS